MNRPSHTRGVERLLHPRGLIQRDWSRIEGQRRWLSIFERRVGSDGVVVLAPLLDHDLSLPSGCRRFRN